MRGPSIRTSAENLGLKDHREISQSLKELIASQGIKKSEVADLSLERINELASLYLKESHRRLWGISPNYNKWPEEEDKIRPHVVEILCRQKENQIENRKRASEANDGEADFVARDTESEESLVTRGHRCTDNSSSRSEQLSRRFVQSASSLTSPIAQVPIVVPDSPPPATQAAEVGNDRRPDHPSDKTSDGEPAYALPHSTGTPAAYQSKFANAQRKRSFDTMTGAGPKDAHEALTPKATKSTPPQPTTAVHETGRSPVPAAAVYAARNEDQRNENTSAEVPPVPDKAQGLVKETSGGATCNIWVAGDAYPVDTSSCPEIIQRWIDQYELYQLELRRKLRKLSFEEAVFMQGDLNRIKESLDDVVTDLKRRGDLSRAK